MNYLLDVFMVTVTCNVIFLHDIHMLSLYVIVSSRSAIIVIKTFLTFDGVSYILLFLSAIDT